MSNRDKTERDWHVLGEFAPPLESGDKESVRAGLMAALDTILLLPSDLERLEVALSEAMIRAERSQMPERARLPLRVRVLISPTVDGKTASGGWGFFVLDKTGEMDVTETERVDQPPRPHLIELYLYADVGSA